MNRASIAFATIFGVFVIAFLMLTALFSFGWLDINWPWEDVVTQETAVAVDFTEGPPQITKITPVSLDCRARIAAEVPVVGTQKTQVAGATVSTDTIRMLAVGDVDTCVSTEGVDVVERTDGTIGVIIDASAIEFVRPRVDAVATMNSVTTDRGIVNQIFEALPFTNENDELTPAAFAFAQTVIGGSDCMQAAYDQTRAELIAAYQAQMVEAGLDRADVDVIISGIPDFGQNDLDPAVLGDFEFVEAPGTSCIVRDS